MSNLQHHPDTQTKSRRYNEVDFFMVQEAYRILSNAKLKAKYDNEIEIVPRMQQEIRRGKRLEDNVTRLHENMRYERRQTLFEKTKEEERIEQGIRVAALALIGGMLFAVVVLLAYLFNRDLM